jgi:beta-mannosidase
VGRHDSNKGTCCSSSGGIWEDSVKVFANRPVKGCFLSVDGGDGDGEGEHGEPEWDDNMVDLMPDEEMHIGVKGLKGIVVRTRFLAD